MMARSKVSPWLLWMVMAQASLSGICLKVPSMVSAIRLVPGSMALLALSVHGRDGNVARVAGAADADGGAVDGDHAPDLAVEEALVGRGVVLDEQDLRADLEFDPRVDGIGQLGESAGAISAAKRTAGPAMAASLESLRRWACALWVHSVM